MATMYETIMDLPLFKGVSKDLVSSFLEKTQLRFTNYIQGDCIVGEGQSFSSIGFIIKGEVVTEISNPEETLRIYGVYGVGRVIGADRHGLVGGQRDGVQQGAICQSSLFRPYLHAQLLQLPLIAGAAAS